ALIFAELGTASLALLATSVLAPQLTDSYGLLRLYQQLLPVLGVAVVVAMVTTLHLTLRRVRAGWLIGPLVAVVVAGCLLTTGGLAPPRPLRILHVINLGTTCGGAERLVAELAAAQRAAGQEVRVLSSDLPGGGVRFNDATWEQPTRGRLWQRLAGQVSNPAARAAL